MTLTLTHGSKPTPENERPSRRLICDGTRDQNTAGVPAEAVANLIEGRPATRQHPELVPLV
jgi:hypothetical protein